MLTQRDVKVLSDPKKRQVYDQFGEEALKGGMPEGGASGFQGFGSNGGAAHFGTRFRSPEDLFSEFFGGASPFTSSFGDAGGGAGGFQSMFHGGGPRGPRALRKQPDTEVNLNLGLEDLYQGVTKKLKISKNVLRADGSTGREDKIHQVEIKPGYKAGTRIRYTGAGGEAAGYQTADVVFIVNEKLHPRFKRNRDNLEVTHSLSLTNALAGTVISVEGIDGKLYQLDCSQEVINPDTVKTISGAGMPISKRPGQKGDLLVRFSISFPSYLNSEKKRKIRNLLS